jgi:hypothetical protein
MGNGIERESPDNFQAFATHRAFVLLFSLVSLTIYENRLNLFGTFIETGK